MDCLALMRLDCLRFYVKLSVGINLPVSVKMSWVLKALTDEGQTMSNSSSIMLFILRPVLIGALAAQLVHKSMSNIAFMTHSPTIPETPFLSQRTQLTQRTTYFKITSI